MVTATASFNTLPENVRRAIFELSKTYSDTPNFLDYIEQMALSNAISERAKKTKYSISRRFRQAGALGLGYDLLKGSFNFLKNIAFPSPTDSLKDMKGYNSFRGISSQDNQFINREKSNTSSILPKIEPQKFNTSSILPKIEPQKSNIPSILPKIEPQKSNIPSILPKIEPQKADKTKTFFEKPIKVLIDGITDEGYRDLLQKLPDIIKRGILDAQKDAPDRYKEILGAIQSSKDQKAGGDGFSLLEALGLKQLLGGRGKLITNLLKFFTGLTGIFTAIYAITTSDPWKGLSKMIAQGLLSVSGVTKTVQNFSRGLIRKLYRLPTNITKFITEPKGILNKIFASVIKTLTEIPGKLFLNFSIWIEKTFGKVAGGKVFDIGFKIFESILPKALKSGLIFLRKVPIIGTLLTIGVAVDRIRKGDYFGGFLDVLSGIAAIFPGIGTGIALAIDALNAFLDYKAGGIGPGKPSKLNIVSGWITGATKWISEKVKDIPYLGSLARAFEHMQKGEWLEGLKSLGHSIPFISELLSFLEYDETTADGKPVDTTNLDKTINLFSKLGEWAKTTIIDKITSWVGGLYDWTKNSLLGLGDTISGWFSSEDIKPIEPKPPEMKDGGLVPATPGGRVVKVAEGGDSEFIIPLSKLEETFTLSNQKLDLIAGNTQTTSSNIKVLSEAILKLAQVFNNKQSTPANNVFINGQQQQGYPSASEIAATNKDPIRPIRMQFMPQMA